MNGITELEDRIKLKTTLLSLGCAIDKDVSFPASVSTKSVHLYAHSTEERGEPIPDDLILQGGYSPILARIRYNSKSRLRLRQEGAAYIVEDKASRQDWAIDFVRRPRFFNHSVGEKKISDVCSYLGTDVLGVVPSNYCFYYGGGNECRFCEILPTYLDKVGYESAAKPPPIIEKAISAALRLDENIRHVAVTSGNVRSYDHTSRLFVEIGNLLKLNTRAARIEQSLATLMPPDDLGLIPELKKAGYTKIYFPLEVYRREQFKVVCPGKDDYGYDRILQALDCALDSFGPGNVYTNFIYGLQSLDPNLAASSFDPLRENRVCAEAVEDMLERRVVPAFTFYHYGGFNSIGKLEIDSGAAFSFFKRWGELVFDSGIVPAEKEAVLFSTCSLSNTLFNDTFLLAKVDAAPVRLTDPNLEMKVV